jgi:hypothetical protein
MKKKEHNTTNSDNNIQSLRIEIEKGWEGPTSKKSVKEIVENKKKVHKK